jgi:hypothetical protein
MKCSARIDAHLSGEKPHLQGGVQGYDDQSTECHIVVEISASSFDVSLVVSNPFLVRIRILMLRLTVPC